MRRQIPLALCFIFGAFMAIQYFIPHHSVADMQERILMWLQTLLAFAFLLGTVSLIKVHYHKIRNRADDRAYSYVALVGLLAMIALGFFHPNHNRPGSPFSLMFLNVQVPIEATMFSLLAFYIASASYRAFRARNTVATLLLVSAVVVMLGRVPIGAAISQFFPAAQEWIMDVPQLAAKRGIQIGAALGAVSMSLRIMLGIERSYLS